MVQRNRWLDPTVLPLRLRERPRFLGYRFGDLRPNGRRAKVPTDPKTGGQIDATNPRCLGRLDDVLAAAKAAELDGVGYSLDPADDLLGVDLDDVLDPATGSPSLMAAGILADLGDTYAEVSPSGNGLRLLAIGRLDTGANCRFKVARLGWGDAPAGLELYPKVSPQFVTLTGDVLDGRAGLLSDHAEYLRELQRSLSPPKALTLDHDTGMGFDGDVIALLAVAFRASNGQRIQRLWNGDTVGYASTSEALLALAGFLSFYLSDPRRLFDLMSGSPLVAATERQRPKWWSPRPAGPWGYACCALPAVRTRTVFFSGLRSADTGYKPPHRETKSVRSEPRSRLLDHCRNLATKKPNGVFHLGVRPAGKAVGLGKSQAAVLLAALIGDGSLVPVMRAKPTPRPGPASTFRLGGG